MIVSLGYLKLHKQDLEFEIFVACHVQIIVVDSFPVNPGVFPAPVVNFFQMRE